MEVIEEVLELIFVEDFFLYLIGLEFGSEIFEELDLLFWFFEVMEFLDFDIFYRCMVEESDNEL